MERLLDLSGGKEKNHFDSIEMASNLFFVDTSIAIQDLIAFSVFSH